MKSNSRPHKINYIEYIFIIISVALILECSAISGGRNSKRSSHLKRNKQDHDDLDHELWDNQHVDLIGLLEEDLDDTVDDHIDTDHLKRRIRSPLDEDIDDVQDSDEDEDYDETSSENKGKKSMKESKTTTEPSSFTTPMQMSILKNGSLDASASVRSNTNSSGTMNAQILIDADKKLKNGTGRSLPPASHSTHPRGATTINSTFSGGGGGGGAPAHGKLPIPSHGLPPHGKLPTLPRPPGIPGKFPPLPPHLLKQFAASKPKPPPKKGELYLPEDYNNLVIPKLNLGKLIGIDAYSAVPVLVFLNIRSVRDIDESLETLTLDLDLVIEWVDGFLFDPISAITVRQADITLNPIFLKKIWRPDIYIDEIVKVKRTSLMSKPLKLKFNPSNGFISYTTRLTVQLSCDMIYFYYPADTHRCEFTFRSYSYFSKDMELSWLGAGVYLQDPYDPNFDLQVESIDRLKLPQTFRQLTNDTYDGLKFTILARRKLSFHMVQTYLPSVFFIVITWLCFLVPARMVEARIGISMTTLLTLTSMFASVRESTPIVSYVKAIDIWMVFCIFFVFLTLLEFATFIWLRARREDAEERKLERQRKLQKRSPKDVDYDSASQRRSSSESIQLQKYEKFAEFTEKYAFAIFSVVFLIFNVIYWTWLLTASNYTDWSVNSTLNADVD